jgi:hypothetical protein
MYSNLIFAIIYCCYFAVDATKMKYFSYISKKRGVKF